MALSGGADSVLLLHLARQAEPAHPLLAVHVDHGLRGEESRGDAAFCARLCREQGLPLVVRQVPLDPRPQGLEARAREARYRVLVEEAQRTGTRTILTAHHADDALETLLLRWTRGTGIGGLAGLARRRGARLAPGVLIVRPLLGLRRAELRVWLAEAGLEHREDSSNQDPTFARNRVRHRVLPAVEQAAGPGGIENLFAFARAVEELERVLEDSTSHLAWSPLPFARARGACAAGESSQGNSGAASPPGRLPGAFDGGVLARGSLMALSPTLQRRALSRLLIAATAHAPGKALLEQVCRDLRTGRLGRHSLAGGWCLTLRAAELVLEPPEPARGPGPRAEAPSPARSQELPFEPPAAKGTPAAPTESCEPRVEPGPPRVGGTARISEAQGSPSGPPAHSSAAGGDAPGARGAGAGEGPAGPEFRLWIPGLVKLADGRRLSAHVLRTPAGRAVPTGENFVELDLERIGDPRKLSVRFPRPGDRFHPFGAPGSKSLSRFLAERGIPRGDRSRVPLVVSGSRVLWVAGVRPAEQGRVGPLTARRLRLELDLG